MRPVASNSGGVRTSDRLNAVWVAAAAAAGFFALALSDVVYDFTSPGSWPTHVVVRKLYSLACFVVLGYLFSRVVPRMPPLLSGMRAAVIVAMYSAAVEIGQRLTGSRESLKWNAVDVALGFIGGAIGGALASVRWRRESAARVAEDLRDERGARGDVDLG
jgi:hypothetical protein